MYLSEMPIKDHFGRMIDPLFNCLVLHEVKYHTNYEKRFLPEYYPNAKIIARDTLLNDILDFELPRTGIYYYSHPFCLMQRSIKRLANYVLKNNQSILMAIDRFNRLDRNNTDTSLRHCSSFRICCNNFNLLIALNTRLICKKIPIVNITWFPERLINKFYNDYEYCLRLLKRVRILHEIIDISETNEEFLSYVPELDGWILGRLSDPLKYVDPYYVINLEEMDYLDKYMSEFGQIKYPIYFPYRTYMRKEEIRLGKLNNSNYFFQL